MGRSDRNVGKNSRLKLDRGLNALWSKEGLMYATPIRAMSGHGFAGSIVAVLLLVAVWLAAEAALALAAGWYFTASTAAALLVRDLLLPALWIAAWLGSGYVWRGNRVIAQPRHCTSSKAARQ